MKRGWVGRRKCIVGTRCKRVEKCRVYCSLLASLNSIRNGRWTDPVCRTAFSFEIKRRFLLPKPSRRIDSPVGHVGMENCAKAFSFSSVRLVSLSLRLLFFSSLYPLSLSLSLSLFLSLSFPLSLSLYIV